MYYHVKIYNKSQSSHRIHVKNLTWEVLQDRVLRPYQQGSEITLEGTTLNPRDIGRVRIVETPGQVQVNQSLDSIIELMGFTYSKDERDLTDELITGSPGGRQGQSILSGNEPTNLTQLFDYLVTNKRLREASRELFCNHHYARAVEEAFKCLNSTVKEQSGISQGDGAGLMKTVFSARSPVLRLNAFESESERNEQQGYMDIFAGSMTGIRNPRAHQHDLIDEPEVALELLVLANHLMRKLDASTRQDTLTPWPSPPS